MNAKRRILIYSHDTYGLGNIRRMLAIAEHLVASDEQTDVLVLSGSPMLHAFRLSPRIDYVKLPCLTRNGQGRYSSRHLNISHDRLLNLRAHLILNTVLDLEPELILVDKKPLGVQNELVPALQVLRCRSRRPKLALVLREILDSPQRTRAVWAKNHYHEAIADLYDRVLVLGSPEIFDTAAEYAFPASTTEKLRYCGYIGKQQPLRPVAQVRADLRVGEGLLVVATAGGGEDGYQMLRKTYEALSNTREGINVLLCTGPEMREAERDSLRTHVAGCSHIRVLDFTGDLMSIMNAADLVVAMAGYNTVTELLQLQKPAVLVPRVEPVQEQWIRATRLAHRGGFSIIHPDQLTAPNLRAAILRALRGPRKKRSACKIDLNALERITQHTAEMLAEDHTGGWERLLLEAEVADAFDDEPLELAALGSR